MTRHRPRHETDRAAGPRRAAAAGALALAAALALAGCSPAGVAIGAGAVAGTAAMEVRGFEQSVTDKSDALTIQKRLADYEFETFRRVDVAVWEGRVLLTGIVPEQADRVQAVSTAWRTEGVVDVINEVLIGEDIGTIDTSRDVRITTALRSRITLDGDIRAVNYILDAVGGTVYLFGVAQSEAELDRVRAHARDIAHVRRIVSHVQLENGPERARLLEKLHAAQQRGEDGGGTAGEAGADDADAGATGAADG